MMALGAFLSARRKELGMTQQEVAEKAGVSRALLVRVEQGNLRTEAFKILAIAHALGLEVQLSAAQEDLSRPSLEQVLSGADNG